MLGWKADYGYITGERPERYPNFDNLVYTDTNMPFVFPTEYSGPISKQNVSAVYSDINYFDYRPGDSVTFFQQFLGYMGDEFSVIYNCPHYHQIRNDVGLIPLFENLKLACPNLWKKIRELHDSSTKYGRVWCVIHIKSLNRYVVYEVSSDPGNTSIYGEDKSLIVSLGQNLQMFSPNRDNAQFLVYKGPNSNEGFLTPTNYVFIVVGFFASYNGPNYYVSSFTDDYSTMVDYLTALFGEFVPPDSSTPDKPYEPGGDSGEGGGGGTFDGDSDQILDSSLPTLSAADTGFTRLYTPTLAQVQDLARYLWTDESIIETLWNVIRRYFEDPMQAFISFSIVPVPVPVAGVEDFKVLFIPTGVKLNTVANQFVDVDCGTFEMKEYYGSALDYSPNTKVSCYLPYIGTVSLNTDDVMGRTLQVKYRVDICSGSCVAKILVDGNVIYQFPGCCSVPIPFTSADFSSYGSAIISAVKTGVALAAAGAGATELGASIIGMNASQQTGESYTKTTVDTVRNPATGRQITAGTQKITKEVTGTKASFSGIAQTGIANTANSVTASKTIVERSGSFSGNSGYLGVRRPYLIIERPRMCMPANYQQLNGFPSMMTMVLSECKGYTRVQQIQLTGVEATNPEQAEILELLKGGVIL